MDRSGECWRRRISVCTDQSSERARATCQRLEQRLASLLAVGFQIDGELPLKLQVVLLDDRAEFEHFVGIEYFGGSARGLPLSPLVVVSRETTSDSWRTLNFSIVDFVVAQSLVRPPQWLLMGLASYFENAYDNADGRIVIGAVPRHYARWLRTHERMSATSVMTYEGPTDLSALYPSAWLMTHYLMSPRGLLGARVPMSR